MAEALGPAVVRCPAFMRVNASPSGSQTRPLNSSHIEQAFPLLPVGARERDTYTDVWWTRPNTIKEGEFVPSPTKLLPSWLAKAAAAPLRSLRSLQDG